MTFQSADAAATGERNKVEEGARADCALKAAEPHQSHDGAAARSESLASGSAAGLPYKRREVIGDATLYLGDCREVMSALWVFDAVVTDPPYGIGFAAQPTKWQRRAGQAPESWDDNVVDLAPLLALGRIQVVWGGNYYSLPPSRGWMSWFKPDVPPSMASIELAWTNLDRNARQISHSISATNAERVGHPTQKPLAVMDWCLASIPEAQTILDPFMGSGTTGVACVKAGRSFTGIEIEAKYFDIACRRIEEAYRQPRLFAEPPQKPEQLALLDGAA